MDSKIWYDTYRNIYRDQFTWPSSYLPYFVYYVLSVWTKSDNQNCSWDGAAQLVQDLDLEARFISSILPRFLPDQTHQEQKGMDMNLLLYSTMKRIFLFYSFISSERGSEKSLKIIRPILEVSVPSYGSLFGDRSYSTFTIILFQFLNSK